MSNQWRERIISYIYTQHHVGQSENLIIYVSLGMRKCNVWCHVSDQTSFPIIRQTGCRSSIQCHFLHKVLPSMILSCYPYIENVTYCIWSSTSSRSMGLSLRVSSLACARTACSLGSYASISSWTPCNTTGDGWGKFGVCARMSPKLWWRVVFL